MERAKKNRKSYLKQAVSHLKKKKKKFFEFVEMTNEILSAVMIKLLDH